MEKNWGDTPSATLTYWSDCIIVSIEFDCTCNMKLIKKAMPKFYYLVNYTL